MTNEEQSKDISRTRDFWSNSFIARLYRKHAAKKFAKMHAAIGQYLAAKKYQSLLDVACGPGDFLAYIHTQIPTARLTGTDLAPGMLSYAREKLGSIATITEALADKQPFPDETFEAITIMMSFHHFPEKEKVLLEMKRLLKKGGALIIADVVAKSNFQKKLWDFLERVINVRGYVGNYTEPELRALGAEAGFHYSIAKVEGTYILGMPNRYRLAILEK